MTDEPDPTAPDPERDVVLDTAALRVLAHPMRLALLQRLRQHGPATVRQLAARLGLDSGAASYHLRRLAAGGLIEEDETLGNRRDRWWRARHRSSHHDPGALPAAGGPESRSYAQALVLAYGDQLRDVATEIVPTLTDDWYAASIFSDYTLRLTAPELDELKRELVGVVARYRDRPQPPDAARRVSVQLQAYPLADRS